MERRPAVVAYDIADHRTRRAALRILREWRLDGQKSVHECLLTRPEAAELVVQLAEVMDPDTDRLLLAWLHTRRPTLARGKGRANSADRRLWDLR
ncbi:MAG TPA: CRISPR-associated endonuclease Cas2 [Lamprocystis sp. (in: g-proteobacteria)]|nr:CRISPR-associated endonuclease Cas2 [Lamprocystis sp. (in: g-proteobacteria)]